MKKSLKIFIIAGEVSGDVLGEKIMRALPHETQFAGIGGQHMKSAGLRPIFPMSDLAVMGIFEVLAHVRTLTRRISETAAAIEEFQPDIVLTIDSPSFVKRVVKKVRKGSHLPKFYHVVAPQVWAWGPKRAKKFAKIFDRLYAFFDFEVPYFEKYGLKTIPVGHPIADGLQPQKEKEKDGEKNIALIPGSRMSEVKKLLPLLRCAAEQIYYKNPDVWWNFYIPYVETTEKYIRQQTADWCTKPELIPAAKRYELFAKTDIAIAASGTVSAELAIIHVPAIIVYKMNPLTELLARILVKTKWVSLVNILLKKTVYPELLGSNATAENILKEFARLNKPAEREKMISELAKADKLWHRNHPAAELIAEDIKNPA
ncbi:MAG: lipid-A-disaccharide synthase [Alphaproteobacteria bacterium]|nr:lipid-A-disaccharide synthase [Alphaproteobacteria bacterium]